MLRKAMLTIECSRRLSRLPSCLTLSAQLMKKGNPVQGTSQAEGVQQFPGQSECFVEGE